MRGNGIPAVVSGLFLVLFPCIIIVVVVIVRDDAVVIHRRGETTGEALGGARRNGTAGDRVAVSVERDSCVCRDVLS